MGNLPIINNLPVNNVPVYNNIPLANLPVFNLPAGNNLPIKNLPLNGVQINTLPIGNRLPVINNINVGNLPVRNTLPIPNNFIQNLPIGNNLPVNCFNSNGMPINLPNCIQFTNANQLPLINNVQFQNNLPVNNINPRPQNFNVLPFNNLAFGQPNNIQITNLPVGQPNNIQFTNVPNGLQYNQLANSYTNQQNFQNVPVNNECSNQSGLSVLVENGLATSGNQQNNAPVVSMNGLQLGGLGGLGNLPLFNGLPVIGVQESVVSLNPQSQPQCTCQN